MSRAMVCVACLCAIALPAVAQADMFQSPVKLAFPPNDAVGAFGISTDAEASVSADRLTLYWHQFRNVEYQSLVSTTRSSVNDAWGGPVNLEPNVNAIYSDEKDPSISQDGLELFYTANNQLYVATRPDTSSPFGAGVPLMFDGSYAEGSYLEGTPEISADGQHLYFNSSKTTLNGMSGRNLFVASRGVDASQWGSVADLGNGISYWPGYGAAFGGDEVSPTVTDDELAIFFSATRLDGGYLGIFMATRDSVGSAFGNRQLVAELNMAGTNNSGAELGFGYSKDDVLNGLAGIYLNRDDAGPNREDLYYAAAYVPEPTTALLAVFGATFVLRRRSRA